ncbi:MAG: methionine adenosyltransferase [Thermoanaerobaculia bacterium]|nr:methionine adenosyltransferase [Thermoanaerobaculia bacterium]
MAANDPYLFTSESVTEGHPDKIADQISDSVLDEVLRRDPEGRVACETMVTTGLVLVAGEITTHFVPDFQEIGRRTLEEIGYVDAAYGISARECAVLSSVDPQSGDIAKGVDPGGAGDQGLMFGFACRETEVLMPLPIMVAHGLTRRLTAVRKSGDLDWLRPDGKSQVTVEYEREGVPRRLHTIVISTQHDPSVSQDEIREAVFEEVIRPTVRDDLLDDDLVIHVNPTGRFVTGGPQGDCGLTGRKIIVDTYGGIGHHGGGAFSGKDPTKVDRSASYMARYIAKNVVAAGLADRLEVQLAYAIGVADPVSVHVESFGTGVRSDAEIEGLIRDHFPLTPNGIIDHLDLKRPIYRTTAAYGHFGREEPELTWERLDRVEQLQRAAGLGDELSVSSG